MGLAAKQDVEQVLALIAAPLAPYVLVVVTDGSVEQVLVEMGLMDEMPVCEP